MTRVVKCIKPTQGLEVGKLYEVKCDNYDLIHLGGEHDGHSRDRFEYVRAYRSQHNCDWSDDGRVQPNNPWFEWTELPTETPKPHPLTKYTRKSNVGAVEQASAVRMGGVKHDNGKLKPSLLLDDMPLAIQEMLKVLKYGADKYAEGNWLKVDDGENRYRNACDRHRLQSSVEEYDTESGLLHLAHEAVNAVMLLELVLRGKGGEK